MRYVIITAAAAALLAGTALAGETMASTSFESLDKNADGRVTVSEATADKGLASGFATADANSDGAVSKEEFAKWTMTAQPKSTPVEPDPAQ